MSPLSPTTAADRRFSAVPLALFRVLFGACLAIDVAGLIEYAPFWFDEVPFIVPCRAPVVPFLGVWLVAAIGLTLGCFTRVCAVVNYLACVAFLGFAAMPAGFEYHLDNLYILTSLGLIFLPVSRTLSIDAWRRPPRDRTVGRLPGVFLALLVSSIYLDSAVWKLSSRLWMEGLGYWVPGSQPWDAWGTIAWTLESEWIARAAGYITLVYELLFVVLVWFRRLRIPLLFVGFVLHVGIGIVIPLPLFGLLMIAFLVALIPMRARDDDDEADEERLSTVRRVGVGGFYASWAVAFSLWLIEPLGALATAGFGGITGAVPRPWHVRSDSSLAHAYNIGKVWSYRLFGFRTHAIFLDSQFSGFTVETRLRYHPPGADPGAGERFYGPIQNRRWLAWNYRMVWPEMARDRVEVQLLRFVTFHSVRRGLDLQGGRVSIEQRAIDLPVDEWRPGQRQKNLESPWRVVGEITGSPGALTVRWDDASWS